MAEAKRKARRSEQVKSYVTSEEFVFIMESSNRAGLSMSEFVRRVCLGFRVESREDQQARRELLKVNADLGRLGGLLKQTLASGHKEQIYGLLHKIDQAQAELKEKIKAFANLKGHACICCDKWFDIFRKRKSCGGGFSQRIRKHGNSRHRGLHR